jgi:hypothetical protein
VMEMWKPGKLADMSLSDIRVGDDHNLRRFHQTLQTRRYLQIPSCIGMESLVRYGGEAHVRLGQEPILSDGGPRSRGGPVARGPLQPRRQGTADCRVRFTIFSFETMSLSS